MNAYSITFVRIPLKSLRVIGLLSGLWFASAANLTQAQEQQPSTGENSTVTYPASYFAEFDPYSVEDMLNRIPGISIARGGGSSGDSGGPGSSRGSDRRGLGAGGDQVLINGRRIAGKENEGNNQLSQISASQVDYIEIIRGTSGDLDVRGGSQVINIVLLEAESSSSVAYEVNIDRYHDGNYDPGAQVSLTGQRGAFNYFLSGEREPGWEFRDSREESILPDGSQNDLRRRDETRDAGPITLVANFGYEFSERDLAHLNLQWVDDEQDTVLDRTIVEYGFENPVVSLEQENLPRDGDSWEFGGDYEHIFVNGSRFKTLVIINEKEDLFIRDRYALDGMERTKNLFLSSFERNRERIIRSSYSFGLGDSQDLEVGVERAQTILDTSLQLGLLTGGDISDAFGGLTPVTNANGTVEEMRYEYFAVHNWQLNDRMSLESTLLFEKSNIKQSGDVYQSRDFDFVRPKLDYRFDITPSLQFRTTIEKDVAQLSFSDFTASAQTSIGTDEEQNALEGNPNLAQEQSWRYEANLEYRLPSDAGVINANVFYHELEDVIEKIDVSTLTNVLSANGNIGTGERYGLKIDGSFRLGFIGQPNMLLTASVNVEDSNIMDPFTNMERKLSSQGRGDSSIGLRHDIPEYNINWGFNLRKGLDGGRPRYDIDKIEDFDSDPTYFSWVEMLGWGGLTYRFELRDSGMRCRFRSRYVNRSIGDGGLREIEKSCFTTGQVLAFKVRGTF